METFKMNFCHNLYIFSLCVMICHAAETVPSDKPILVAGSNQTKQSKYLYQTSTSILNLEWGKPMKIMINTVSNESSTPKVGQVIGSALLPEASFAQMTDQKVETKDYTTYTMGIAFNSNFNGTNLDLTKVQIDIQMILDHATKYWNISSMDISVTGKLQGNCTDCDINLKNSMNVAPKRGYTSNPVDLNCQRDYTICAPVNLCWTCSDQWLNVAFASDFKDKTVVSILIPGMQLQPLATNGTKSFGYRWDCDPIWGSALWFSLLLSLFFIVILAWAIDMLVTLQTPSRFDDPKGKPLVVPLTD